MHTRSRRTMVLLQLALIFSTLMQFQVNSYADGNTHIQVQKSLVHLIATATAETGPLTGVPEGLKSQATGFFVGGDGFLLTTQHFFDPIEKHKGVNIKMTASIGAVGPGNTELDVKFVSELPRLDLMLLKADLPFNTPAPMPLKLGSSNQINRADPQPLFTSGFHDNDYRQLQGTFNKASSDSAPYVWSMNVKTNAGQSGSPVYLDDGTVVGVIKGTKSSDDELTLVIPIEYSLPLIGHFRIERLEATLNTLIRYIGEIQSEDSPPIGSRLQIVESNLKEIEKQFFWSTQVDAQTGAIDIRYEKLISGGPQVESISVRLKPDMRMIGDVTPPMSALKLKPDGSTRFERNTLTTDRRVGVFVIPNVQRKLEGLLELTAEAVGKPDPFRDLELTIVPSIDGGDLSAKRFKVSADYDWN